MELGIGLRMLLILSVTTKNQRMTIPCTPTSHSPRKSSTEKRTRRPALCHLSPHPVCYPERRTEGRKRAKPTSMRELHSFVYWCSSLWRWRSRTFEGHHALHTAILPPRHSLATRLPGCSIWLGTTLLICCIEIGRMALLNLQALGTSSLQPRSGTAPLTRCHARASSSTISDVVTIKVRRICGTQHLSCGGSFLSSGSRDFVRLQRLHALSLQMVTADHDNSDEQDSEPPAEPAVEATDSSLEFQGKDHLRQMLVDSLQGFQEGLKDLRDRGVLESAKLGYQDAQEKVKNLDAKQLITDLKSSSLSMHGARWWRTSDPWIKWPLAVFGPFYLLVTLIFGIPVSQELLPLWILGPLSTGIIIRQCCRAAELSRVLAEKTASQRAQLSAITLAIYKDAKDGTLPDKAKLLVESKLAGLEEKVSTKRSEITVCVTNGQAAAGAKDFSINKLNELWEHAVETYADYMEWWRPKGRALSRWLKKIF